MAGENFANTTNNGIDNVGTGFGSSLASGVSIGSQGIASLLQVGSYFQGARLRRTEIKMNAQAAQFAYDMNEVALQHEQSNVQNRLEQDMLTFDLSFKQSLDEQIAAYAEAGVTLSSGSALDAINSNVRLGQLQRKLMLNAANDEALSIKLALVQNNYNKQMTAISADLQGRLANRSATIQAANAFAQAALQFSGAF